MMHEIVRIQKPLINDTYNKHGFYELKLKAFLMKDSIVLEAKGSKINFESNNPEGFPAMHFNSLVEYKKGIKHGTEYEEMPEILLERYHNLLSGKIKELRVECEERSRLEEALKHLPQKDL